jgi:NAD(P)H-dependent FMN reductase
MATLLVMVGSTRPGRVGTTVADWFVDRAKHHSGFDLDVVDLAELDLPFLDEPAHPRLQRYEHDHTKAWSERVEAADAVVLVSPEYNTGCSAPMKNAIDYLSLEWRYKPVGFVTYGGVSAGTRAMEQLVQIVAVLQMVPVMPAVNIPFVAKLLDDSGALQANDVMDKAAAAMLDELTRVEAALRQLR